MMGVVACALLFAIPASAVMLDDFEDGNLIEWTQAGSGGVYSAVTPAAAHDGNLGCELGSSRQTGWLYRDDVTVGEGDVFWVWTTLNNSSNTRNYVGFCASAAGCWSLVLAPNTTNLIIQRNSGYGFTTLAEVPYGSWIRNYWYRAEIALTGGGQIIGNVYDSDGTTLLASVSAMDPGCVSGGIAMRTFGDGGDAGYWDSWQTEGATPVQPKTWGAIKDIYR
jgi:hypothetical protein